MESYITHVFKYEAQPHHVLACMHASATICRLSLMKQEVLIVNKAHAHHQAQLQITF